MSFGNIPNYRGTNTGNEQIVESDGSVFLKVYNDSGSAYARGVVYSLTYTVASGICYADVVAPTTTGTASIIVGVVNNSPLGKDTIADGEYGFIQIKGYCPYAVTSGTVHENDQLEVLTTAAAFIDQGTNGGAVTAQESVGVAIAEVTTNVWSVWLMGKPVVIKGT